MLYSGLWCGINSSVGQMCRSLWQDDFTYNPRRVVNRLKIPRVSAQTCVVSGGKSRHGAGWSAVLHREENDPLSKAAISSSSTSCWANSLVHAHRS